MHAKAIFKLSWDETQYHCQECETLVAKEAQSYGRCVMEIDDRDHVPEG